MKTSIRTLILATVALAAPCLWSERAGAVPLNTPTTLIDINGGQTSPGPTMPGWYGWDIPGTTWTLMSGGVGTPVTNNFGGVQVVITPYTPAAPPNAADARDRGNPTSGPFSNVYQDFIYVNRDPTIGLGKHYLKFQFGGLTANTDYEVTMFAYDANTGSSTTSYMAYGTNNPAGYGNYQPAPGSNNRTIPILARLKIAGPSPSNPYDYASSFFVKTDGSGAVTAFAWNDSDSYNDNLISLCNGIALGLATNLVTVTPTNPPTIPSQYKIGTWRGFRPAALSYTFDDDLPNQYAIAVPMFNAKGFKLTLYTVINWLPSGSWSPVQNAALFGHEIASHTVTHTDLSTLSDAQQTNELKNSQDAIKANISGEKCVTLAYPNCVLAKESITSQYYIAARSCSGQLVPSTPPDFFNISSFVCGALGPVRTTLDFNNTAENAAAANAWCVYLIHAMDAENGYSPLPSMVLQGAVDYVSTNQSKFWVETFGNVVRYIKERDASSVMEISNTADSITIQVTNNLDSSIYDYPITLRRPLPTNWLSAVVLQNNKSVGAQIVSVSSTNYIMFDVVPNGGDVTISKVPLPFTLSNPALTTPTSFAFRLNGQAGVRYAIHSSSNLVNWSPVQTNTLVNTYTNFTFAVSNSLQFYRAQWVP